MPEHMPERLRPNSLITLIEQRPRSFGRLYVPGTNRYSPEPPDVYSIGRYPPRAIPILHGVTIKTGFTNVVSIAPAFNPGGKLTAEDWDRFDRSALVGISSLSRTVDVDLDLARKIKERNPEALIVFGGYHPTFDPEYCLTRGADVVVIREGDETWPELLMSFVEKGTYKGVTGLAYMEGGRLVRTESRKLLTAAQLSKLSLPVYSEAVLKGQTVCAIESSRGCPKHCNFCLETVFHEGKYKRRSNESILEEWESLPKGVHRFWTSDNFAVHIHKTKELLEEGIRRNLTPLGAVQIRAKDVARDRELVELFRRAGTSHAFIGFESVNEESLIEANKEETIEDYELAINALGAVRIPIFGMFILGFDADTPTSLRKTVDWAIKRELFAAQFFALGPLIGTPYTAAMASENRLLSQKYHNSDYYHEDGPKLYLFDGHHVHIEPNNFTPLGLQIAVVDAYRQFYSFRQLRFSWEDFTHRAYAYRTVSRISNDPQTIEHLKFLKSIEPPRVFKAISLS